MKKYLLNGLMIAAAFVLPAFAQTAHATEPKELTGYQCMALAKSYGPGGMDYPGAPVYAGPEASARQVGIGAGVLIAHDPMTPVDGRVEVLRSNGRPVWVETTELTKWHALADPTAKCTPQIQTNGRYGFYTHH